VVRGGKSLVDEVENREEQERFVRTLMAFPRDADNSDVEVVQTSDGGIEEHGVRKAENLIAWKGKEDRFA